MVEARGWWNISIYSTTRAPCLFKFLKKHEKSVNTNIPLHDHPANLPDSPLAFRKHIWTEDRKSILTTTFS